ncbi:MAG TPA: BMP family ABC transporter substrate-binding protein, partial [Desulfobacteria bacterium]|nr:BMP family ABC transporter substrate-binding protein [Desulfobacteria bacterium]
MAIKRVLIVGLLIAAVTLLSGCTLQKASKNGEWEQYGTKGPKKIGLVLPASEKEASSVYEAVSAAANKASLEQGAEYRVMAPGDLANDGETLRYLAENQFDLILTLGRGIEKDLNKVAEEYSDIRFAVIGGEVDRPNVTSIKFDRSEGAFLAGVL